MDESRDNGRKNATFAGIVFGNHRKVRFLRNRHPYLFSLRVSFDTMKNFWVTRGQLPSINRLTMSIYVSLSLAVQSFWIKSDRRHRVYPAPSAPYPPYTIRTFRMKKKKNVLIKKRKKFNKIKNTRWSFYLFIPSVGAYKTRVRDTRFNFFFFNLLLMKKKTHTHTPRTGSSPVDNNNN